MPDQLPNQGPRNRALNFLYALIASASFFSAPTRSAAVPTAHRASEVLVVYNADSPISTAIAQDYAARRGVTALLPIHCADSALSSAAEMISLKDYTAQIAAPVSKYLASHKNINFIVLTKGVPILIDGGNYRLPRRARSRQPASLGRQLPRRHRLPRNQRCDQNQHHRLRSDGLHLVESLLESDSTLQPRRLWWLPRHSSRRLYGV